MTPDPLDQLGSRLFESARSEAIPHGAPQRALAAIQRELSEGSRKLRPVSPNRRWLAASVSVAIAAAAALLLRPKDTSPGISAEPSQAGRARLEPRRAPSTAPRLPSVMASSDAPPIVPSAAFTAKSVRSLAPVPPATLSDELGALKVASSALSTGDAQAALAALDRYDRVIKGQKLRAEATLLKIEALSRAGQTEAASALAQRFVDHNPGSPLVDRARMFVVE